MFTFVSGNISVKPLNLQVMTKKLFKIEELDAFTPIKNEEAKFLCGGAEPISDLSKTEGSSTHSSSSDADANTQDSDGATRPVSPVVQPNWV